MQVLLPEGWPRPKGYANGVKARGTQVFIAGMIGWDAQCVFHSDDFAGRQFERHVIEDEARGTRVGERHVLEPNPSNQACGRRQVGGRHQRPRVVFEPRQAPRSIHPDPPKESDLPDGCADVRRQSGTGGEHQQHIARWRAEAG